MLKKMFKSFTSIAITVLLLTSLAAVASADHIPGHKEKSVNYNCNSTVYLLNVIPVDQRNFDITVDIEAYDVPDSVNPGQKYTLKNASATVTVPGHVVLDLYNILGWTYISGNVNKFEVHSDNLPQTIDVAPQTIQRTQVPTNGDDFVFRVPANGGIDVGEFTAGQSGVINISAGNIEAEFVNDNYNDGFKLVANCQPIGDPTLTTININ